MDNDPDRGAGPMCPPAELLGMAAAFAQWLARAGHTSYDPYDIWGTRYGVFARRLYYAGNPAGAALAAPLLLMEALCPGLRGLWVKKQGYATAHAQLVLGFLNLHRLTRDPAYLQTARVLGGELRQLSIPGYSGCCWGYPFDWQNKRGLWRKNTPYITATPYCFEALAGLFEATREEQFRVLAGSAAEFVHTDLRDTATTANAAAASYSPTDQTQVVNASAYRAFVLIDAAWRFDRPAYLDKARRNINFVLETQRPDGSWLYAVDTPAEAFIDHFHTCFVLKNLFKLNRYAGSEDVRKAIHKGFAYYRSALFDAEDNPRYFAVQPRAQIVRLELYNFAEAITLGALLKDEVPGAFELAHKLARRVRERFQLADGHFVTRVYRGGLRHTLPFLRWPQSQMFYAITNLLVATAPAAPAGRPDAAA